MRKIEENTMTHQDMVNKVERDVMAIRHEISRHFEVAFAETDNLLRLERLRLVKKLMLCAYCIASEPRDYEGLFTATDDLRHIVDECEELAVTVQDAVQVVDEQFQEI